MLVMNLLIVLRKGTAPNLSIKLSFQNWTIVLPGCFLAIIFFNFVCKSLDERRWCRRSLSVDDWEIC